MATYISELTELSLFSSADGKDNKPAIAKVIANLRGEYNKIFDETVAAKKEKEKIEHDAEQEKKTGNGPKPHSTEWILRKARLDECTEKADAEYWKSKFIKTGNILIEDMVKKFGSVKPEKPAPTKISYNGKVYEFTPDVNVFLIGRKIGCHIQFPPNTKSPLSRLSAILFNLPKCGVRILVDVGSCNGFVVKARGDVNQRPISLPSSHAFAPKVIAFSSGESVQIQFVGDLPTSFLTIEPKICLVCINRARQVKFEPCKHFVTCETCSKLVKGKCPLCRSTIDWIVEHHGDETNADSALEPDVQVGGGYQE